MRRIARWLVEGRRTLRMHLARAPMFIAALAVGVGSASTLGAQANSPNPSVARLGDLYDRVARDNPRVAVAEALVRAAQARAPGASRLPDPQLQLGFMNYSLPNLAPMPPLGMTQLQIMQMVPLGGKLALGARVANAQTTAAQERARDVVWELRSQIATAFYDVYAIDRQLEIARETLHLLEDISQTAQSMYRVGEGRQTDVLRADVEIARMVEDTIRMRAMRRALAARISALVNDGDDRPWPDLVRPRFPADVPSESWLDSAAMIDRPMIRAGVEDARAAGAAATLARREIIPDLQIGVQYGQRAATMTTVDAAGLPTAERTTERMGSLMIGVSIPIFARDRQLQMRNEANAMKAMAEADVAAMRSETRGKIGEAYADLIRARDLGRLYRTTVLPQAEATVASALSSYRVGRVDFMTLLDDQMTVNKYKQELATLEADEGKAWAALEMLTGRELIDSKSNVADVAATEMRGDR